MQIVNVGQTVEIVIRVAGVPLPYICWYRNNNGLVATKTITVTTTEESLMEVTGKLVISQINISDIERIRVVATNDAGEEEARIPLSGTNCLSKVLFCGLTEDLYKIDVCELFSNIV